jgi:hypothetical protein
VPSYYRDADAPLPNGPLHVGVTFVVEFGSEVLIDRRRDDDELAWDGRPTIA